MKLGCHAVLYGPKLAEDPELVFSQIAATGFSGAEVGIRFMQDAATVEKVLAAAEKYNVEISAIHAGSSLMSFVDAPETAESSLYAAVAIAKNLRNKNIAMSGSAFISFEDRTPDPRLSDPDFVKSIALKMEEIAKYAKGEGVTIGYHNHSWEFTNDGLIIKAILKFAPSMNLAMDCGWAYFSGFDPMKIISENPTRFNYVHVRDYNQELKEFVNLGEGDLDLKALLSLLEKTLPADGWAVVEYETGPQNYKRYATAKVYIDHLMK